jgi:hypothetical protein
MVGVTAKLRAMTTGEATRQFQATLEARPALRNAFEGTVVSAEDELREADDAVAQAEAAMFRAWIEDRPEIVEPVELPAGQRTSRLVRAAAARIRPRIHGLAIDAGLFVLAYVIGGDLAHLVRVVF